MEDCIRFYRDKETHIQVTIKQHATRYEVQILMPEGTFSKSKKIHIESKELSLSAVAVNCDLPWQGPYAITINRGYQKGKYGLIQNVQATSKFRGRNCFGRITLNPKFYIPESKCATSKNLKKAEAIKARQKFQRVKSK